MELIGNGTTENAPCLRVQSLQSTGGEVNRKLSGHKQILIKDEFHFLIGFAVLLDKSGACVDF